MEPSLLEVRRSLRDLPRERRKDVIAAMRAGRAVTDPRDASLAIAWAERLGRVRWPRWIAPRSRPSGNRAWLWLGHAALMLAALIGVCSTFWSQTPHSWRWAIVVVIAYTAVSTPIVTIQTLRLYWNASAAAKENRRVWGFTDSGSSDSNAWA
jgi:hypothetical protein